MALQRERNQRGVSWANRMKDLRCGVGDGNTRFLPEKAPGNQRHLARHVRGACRLETASENENES